MISKIFGLFANIMTAYDKNSVLNRDNLMNSIQMQLSKEEKYVAQIFKNIFQIWIKLWTFWKEIWAT